MAVLISSSSVLNLDCPTTIFVPIMPSIRNHLLPRECKDTALGHVMPQESPTLLGLWDLGHTPINCSVLKTCLSSYPDKEAATELENGFCYGFKLKYTGSRQSSMSHNLKSALEYPQVIQEKVLKEVSLGRIFGPFKTPPLANLKISPIGVVPKANGRKLQIWCFLWVNLH